MPEPPVNGVPVMLTADAEAAPFCELLKIPLEESAVKAPVLGVVDPIVPGVAQGTLPLDTIPVVSLAKSTAL